jgi:hypothetical protein
MPADPIKVRVVSDGTPEGTIVTDAASGRPFETVTRIVWELDAARAQGQGRLTLWLESAEIELLTVPEPIASDPGQFDPSRAPVGGPWVRPKPEVLAARRAMRTAQEIADDAARILAPIVSPRAGQEYLLDRAWAITHDPDARLTGTLIRLDGEELSPEWVRVQRSEPYSPDAKRTLNATTTVWEADWMSEDGMLNHVRTNFPVLREVRPDGVVVFHVRTQL